MTDNGLAALAAALRAAGPDSPYLDGGEHDRQWAAAILGERGVFLPDGVCNHIGLINALKDNAATIATLRAALDAHHGAREYERAACNICALATAKEAGHG